MGHNQNPGHNKAEQHPEAKVGQQESSKGKGHDRNQKFDQHQDHGIEHPQNQAPGTIKQPGQSDQPNDAAPDKDQK